MNETYRDFKKENKTAYDKARYITNSDKIKARSKAWCEANPEKVKERSKIFYEANKEKIKIKSKTYYKLNPEKSKAHSKAWREANPEKSKAHSKTYRKVCKQNGTNMVGWLTKQYKNVPCLDCNNLFPWCVMDFDHRPEEIKSFNISNKGSTKATIKRIAIVTKEIDKCDLVCANCHRIRTANRRRIAP